MMSVMIENKSVCYVLFYVAIGFVIFLTNISAEYNEGLLYNPRFNVLTNNKRWFPVKEFHYDEPLEIKKRSQIFYKRWFPVKEFHYGEPLEVKKRFHILNKRWSPVKEFHYDGPIEVRK
ncbi:unnamed protein product [Schistosoma turkestanicum]|nr:unnamed protein product [Schistosoma turkestanicum]